MTHTTKLVLAGFVLLAMTGAATAETGKSYVKPTYFDIVRDSSGNAVRSTNGECVRTHWMADCDVCPKTGQAAEVTPTIALEERTVYFNFGKASLTKEAKKKLDTLATTIRAKGFPSSIKVAGYADRIGSAAKNEKLSKKRAEAVRKYLATKGFVVAPMVETRWFGDTKPATQCPKKMAKDKLIACLKKDRRVEIEVDFPPMAAPAPVAK